MTKTYTVTKQGNPVFNGEFHDCITYIYEETSNKTMLETIKAGYQLIPEQSKLGADFAKGNVIEIRKYRKIA